MCHLMLAIHDIQVAEPADRVDVDRRPDGARGALRTQLPLQGGGSGLCREAGLCAGGAGAPAPAARPAEALRRLRRQLQVLQCFVLSKCNAAAVMVVHSCTSVLASSWLQVHDLHASNCVIPPNSPHQAIYGAIGMVLQREAAWIPHRRHALRVARQEAGGHRGDAHGGALQASSECPVPCMQTTRHPKRLDAVNSCTVILLRHKPITIPVAGR